ncbi:hypothetical protein BDR07DRAFT_1488439 [Suillus spraguei]|nr:hypothetical protein BDR07DRAFT_1488439 [Suillus spraguei]
MAARKKHAKTMAKKHFSKEVFDMCWSTESEAMPLVETPTSMTSAEPHYSSQTFEMCWDVEPNPVPTVNALVKASSVNAPAKASSAKQHYGGEAFMTAPAPRQYDLCCNDVPSLSKVASVSAITVDADTLPV